MDGGPNDPDLSNVGLKDDSKVFEGAQNFDIVNWIINQDPASLVPPGTDSSVTSIYIQAAIWLLVDNNLVTSSGIPFEEFYNDNIDGFADVVNNIRDTAIAQGEGFVPGFGDQIALILVPDETDDGLSLIHI